MAAFAGLIAVARDSLSRLQARERAALLGGGLLAVVLLGYFLGWQPLQEQRALAQKQLAASRELLQWMAQAAQEVRSLKPSAFSAAPEAGVSLLALIDQALSQSPLGQANKRIEPRGEKTVQVDFDKAGFDDLLAWLESLQYRYGIQASAASLERLAPGQVKARITLERGL
jgi:type II secretory pathway component PulM